jgi:hypothetical protein
MAPNKPRTHTSHIMIMLPPEEKAEWEAAAKILPFEGNTSAMIRTAVRNLIRIHQPTAKAELEKVEMK